MSACLAVGVLLCSSAGFALEGAPVHPRSAKPRIEGLEARREEGRVVVSYRVAHGLLALGAISRLIGAELPGPGSLWLSHQIQFVTPVLAGDRLKAQVSVKSISLAAQSVVLAAEVVNAATGAMVLRGTAVVRIPPRSSAIEA